MHSMRGQLGEMKYDGVVSAWGLPCAVIAYHGTIKPLLRNSGYNLSCAIYTTSSLHITILYHNIL